MRAIKRALSHLPVYVLWAMASFLIWGWVFMRITDAPRAKKVTIFVFSEQVEDAALAQRLSEDLPEGIRMVQVHSYAYVMMDSRSLETADILIMPRSGAETWEGDFIPLEPDATRGREVFYRDGEPCGVRIYDALNDRGGAEAYILYQVPGEVEEDWFLFFGSAMHAGERDRAALDTAERLLAMDGP